MKTHGPSILSPIPVRGPVAASFNHACPRCNSAVFNVSLRFVDLLISVFIPVRRYRCISMQCSWEGNLRDKRQPGRADQSRLNSLQSIAGRVYDRSGKVVTLKAGVR